MDKTQYFNGIHFTRDDKTGYYLNSTIKERIHRYVWKHYKGEIPKGYEVHHKDHNKSNNSIDNLELLQRDEHLQLHAKIQGDKNVESGLLDKIRPLTKEWHASDEGKEWHKKHYEKTKDKLNEKIEFTCENCGVVFIAVTTGSNRFCSNKCKSAWRRKSGVDDETRICEYCGNEFRTNKYTKTKCCSKSCANKLRFSQSK